MFPTGVTALRGFSAYSDWFPAFSDNATFGVEVIQVHNTATLTISVYHKTSIDTGDGVLFVTFPGVAGPGVVTFPPVNGLKQLVRLQFAVTGPNVDPDEWVNFRMLAPSWYNRG